MHFPVNLAGSEVLHTSIHYDATSEPDVDNTMDATTTGNGKLDILFNRSPVWQILLTLKSLILRRHIKMMLSEFSRMGVL